jgi:transposase
MPRIRTLSPNLLAEAQSCLKNLPDSKVQFRLLAIVKTSGNSIQTVAQFFSIHANTLSRWIQRFEDGGIEALQDKPKGHAPCKLSGAQLKVICQWVETERNVLGETTHWTLEKLRAAILQQWGITLAVGPLWRQLRLMGYRHKSVRPRHTNQPDAAAVDTFKKTLKSWSTTF